MPRIPECRALVKRKCARVPEDSQTLADYLPELAPQQKAIPIGRAKQAVDIPGVKAKVELWLTKNQLHHCPASGLFIRAHDRRTGREREHFTPEYLWSQMDVEGEFTELPGITEKRFMAVLKQMYNEQRFSALAVIKDKLAPPLKNPSMNYAIDIAKTLLRYYGSTDFEDPENGGDELRNSALMLVHTLWLTKRKLFGLEDYFPTMLTFWSKEEGSCKSGFINALFAPLEPFTERSTFSIFADKFGCAPFGQYYALIFPEMAGVQKASIDRLKEIIEQDYFTDRDMYTKLGVKTIRRATCVNSSNHPPPHGLKIDGVGRRFFSIHFSEVMRAPSEIRSYLKLVRSMALELWQAIDVHAEPVINEDFKDIRAQQKRSNRPENIMDAFLEVQCTRLDERVEAANGTRLAIFRDAFDKYVRERSYPWRGVITLKVTREMLEQCGALVKRVKDAPKKEYAVCSHILNDPQ